MTTHAIRELLDAARGFADEAVHRLTLLDKALHAVQDIIGVADDPITSRCSWPERKEA